MLTDTHCLDLLLLQNLLCNISYVCCSITFNIRIYCDLYRCWLLLQSLWCCVFGCFLFLSAGIEANCLFFFLVFFLVFFFLFFFFSLSLSIPHSPFFSLSLPFFVDFPHNLFFYFFFFIYLFIFIFFPFFFLLSLSCFLCPLVLSVTVWLSKRVYKIKLIN